MNWSKGLLTIGLEGFDFDQPLPRKMQSNESGYIYPYIHAWVEELSSTILYALLKRVFHFDREQFIIR